MTHVGDGARVCRQEGDRLIQVQGFEIADRGNQGAQAIFGDTLHAAHHLQVADIFAETLTLEEQVKRQFNLEQARMNVCVPTHQTTSPWYHRVRCNHTGEDMPMWSYHSWRSVPPLSV